MKEETVKLTIKQIEEKLETVSDPFDPFITECKQDGRKGVLHLIQKWEKNYERMLAEEKRLEEMFRYERQIKAQGFQLVAGVDEVGRGPLAGPVVAAAVMFPDNFYLPGINDSKKLPPQKREQLYEQIRRHALSVGIGIVEAEEIDRLNIYRATKKAMSQAVSQLSPFPDYLLVDAMSIDVPIPQLSLVKGDAKSASVAGASIIAKVYRDRLMENYGKVFPHYGFEKHMGYPTKEHLEAIRQYGPTVIHRKSFAPVREVIEGKIGSI